MKIFLALPSIQAFDSSNDIFAPGLLFRKLSEGLKARGHEVILFPVLEYISQRKNIDLISVEDEKYQDAGGAYGKVIGGIDFEADVTRQVYAEAKLLKPDLIHFFSYFAGHYFTDFIDIPSLFTVHDVIFSENTYEYQKYTKFPEHEYSFVSLRQMQNYIKTYGLKNTNFIYNGVEHADYSYKEKSKRDYFLYIGRMIEEKGFHYALELSRMIDIPLYFCTSNADKTTEYFKSLLPKINAVGAVDLGFVSGAQRDEVYRNALFTLFPSTWDESFGMVIIESMLAGTPVVGFDTGALSEIIENDNDGFICHKSNSLTENLLQFSHCAMLIKSKSESEYSNLSHNAYKKVINKFLVANMVDGYEKLYEKILSKYQKRV